MTVTMPVVHETVVHMLCDAAGRSPRATALICGQEALTYDEYAACVAGLAEELISCGASSGRVVTLMANSIDIAIATFGVQAAGAQVVPLNPAYTAYELAPILENASSAAVIHDVPLDDAVERLFQSLAIPCRIAIGPGARRLTAWRGRTDLAVPLPISEAKSTLQYTGGTTGRPKGVDLTHRAVAINVAQREALLPTVPDGERILAMTPLFHVYAVAMGLYLAAYCRGALTILPRYRPDVVLASIARDRTTLLSGSPTIFTGLMAHEDFDKADLSSLRLCFSGASALPEETLRRWETATGCPICEGYGQSEAGPVLTFNPRYGQRKSGSVGVSVPLTAIEIVDTETGTRVLPPGEIGEIRARGPQIMSGYRGLVPETAEAMRDGWLYTGDIGVIDTDRYLFIRDRKKDMVIVSGYNVYPREVEEILHSHSDVCEAAVIGVPDAYRGEALVGFVVPNAGINPKPEDLQFYVEKRLVHYKVPSEIRIVPSLPKTVVGKVDKKLLRVAQTE